MQARSTMNTRLAFYASTLLVTGLGACASTTNGTESEAADLTSGSSGLTVEVFRGGARLTPKSDGAELSTFAMKRGEFELRFPKLTGDPHLRVTAWTDESVKIEEGASIEGTSFGPATGMATNPGDLLLNKEAHNFLIGPRVHETEDGRLAATVSNLLDVRNPAQPLKQVFLTAFVDMNDNGRFDSGEYTRIKLDFDSGAEAEAEPAEATTDGGPPPAKPTSLTISWNRVTPTADYSFDVMLRDGRLIGPCVDAAAVKKELSLVYSGKCTSPKIDAPLQDVRDVRICSAENGVWTNAICTDAHWDGVSSSVKIKN